MAGDLSEEKRWLSTVDNRGMVAGEASNEDSPQYFVRHSAERREECFIRRNFHDQLLFVKNKGLQFLFLPFNCISYFL